MGNAVFPTLAGLDWNVKRTPTFRTLLTATANGNTVRVPLLIDPMWMFECSFEFLRDDQAHDELNQLLGFFLTRQGSYDSFLLDLGSFTRNPLDSAVLGQMLAVDANNCAPLVRTLGGSGYNEAVYELNGTPTIYLNGAAQSAAAFTIYTAAQSAAGTLNANGISYAGCVVKFNAALAARAVVTADFGFYYRVIFSAGKGSSSDPQLGGDQQDFEAILLGLYQAQKITLVTSRE